jgi:hypothetical protein
MDDGGSAVEPNDVPAVHAEDDDESVRVADGSEAVGSPEAEDKEG